MTGGVFENLKEVLLSFLDVDEGRLTPDAAFASLDLASLDWVEIQIELEVRCGVRVNDGLIKSGRLRTLGDLVQHIEALLQARPAP